MTLESAFTDLTAKFNQVYLKQCELEEKIDKILIPENYGIKIPVYNVSSNSTVISDITINRHDVAIKALANALVGIYLKPSLEESPPVFIQISTAPYLSGNSLNSGFQPTLSIISTGLGGSVGQTIQALKTTLETNCRAMYASYIEKLQAYFEAYRNDLPTEENARQFFSEDSAEYYAVEGIRAVYDQAYVPINQVSERYSSFLNLCFWVLTKNTYRSELEAELVTPLLFDEEGNLIETQDSNGNPIDANVAKLQSKKTGFANNTQLGRNSALVTAQWLSYVASLKEYVNSFD